jgi:anti-sigma factor RsiW
MKLVETDIHGPKDDEETPAPPPTPPRPEHRRVAVSLLLTVSVLVATAVTVYVLFPERHNLLMTEAIDAHGSDAAWELERPSDAELRAWSLALVGRGVPLPAAGNEVQVLGARSIQVLHRPTAVVGYQVGGDRITLVVQRAREAVPRRHRRVDEGLMAVSWRKGAFTFVAVGPEASAERWRAVLGVP